jgi:hypothetical protein
MIFKIKNPKGSNEITQDWIKYQNLLKYTIMNLFFHSYLYFLSVVILKIRIILRFMRLIYSSSKNNAPSYWHKNNLEILSFKEF